jgi:S-adenosylmethionine:tRNA ribosyltransferase-isomerase
MRKTDLSDNSENIVSAYDYDLPEGFIATSPAHPRESAKMLSYSRDDDRTDIATFADLPSLLPPGSLLVFNRTKVVPAKLSLRKKTGGALRVICLDAKGNLIRVMSDRKLDMDTSLVSDSGYSFVVERQDGKYFYLRPIDSSGKDVDIGGNGLYDLLFKIGETPLPPYIKNSPLPESALREEYQSVFAEKSGSVAAPTASLHFTEGLLEDLKKAGHSCVFITLHVGLGTFAPLTEESMVSGKLHEESYEIPTETISAIDAAKRDGRPVIAVGTTSVRALESSADDDGHIVHPSGVTDLFIREGYRFRIVDGLITNFHVPRSSLLMLVAAFIGRDKIMELYRRAMDEKFRFFSFGDGMFIYPAGYSSGK